MTAANIGFVGVGLMGHGIAANLLKTGNRVSVIVHRNRAPIDDLVAQGATEAADYAGLAAGKDLVFTCVSGSPQVEQVLDALAPYLTPGAVVVDVTTADPVSTDRLHARLAARGIALVDAPVSGGPAQAEAGHLTSIVGATAEALERVRPFLESYSRAVVHMGGPGLGHRAKLLNNIVTNGTVVLLIHAYRSALKAGLDPAKLHRIMMGGAARSGTLEKMIGPMLEGNYQGHPFSVANAEKDVRTYVAMASALGEPTAVPDAVHAFFARAVDHGFADRMVSELLRPGIGPVWEDAGP